MLISVNERFLQEINADQLVLNRTKPKPSFWKRKLKYPCQSVFTENEPHKSFIFQNKLTPWFLSKVWNGNENFRLVFTKMLVFMSKTGFIMPAPVSVVAFLFSIVGAQLCILSEKKKLPIRRTTKK
jgi:hypothetical protein